MALPKRYRIALSKQSFALLRKTGRSISTRVLKACYIKNPNVTNSRFAVIVGGNVAKKAVARNRIRRLIQAELLENLPRTVTVRGLPITLRVDMIVYPKRMIAGVNKNLIREEVEQLLKKIEI